MARTTILVMIDGLDPEYLDACPTAQPAPVRPRTVSTSPAAA